MKSTTRPVCWPLLPLALAATLAACGDSTQRGSETIDDTPDAQACADDFDCPVGLICIDQACVEPEACLTDDDCPGELVCRGEACVPGASACVADPDCPDGQICEEELCRTGCRVDADCPQGRLCEPEAFVCFTPIEDCGGECPMFTRCDMGTGDCVPDGTCAEDGDCLDGQLCDDGECVDLGDRCEINADCPDDQFCDRDMGLCVPGCRQANQCRIEEVCVDGECTEAPECEDDALEPNNTSDEPSTLSPGEPLTGQALCADEDWYEWTSFAGDELTLTLSFEHDFGDLSLQLYDPRGELLQLSATPDNDEVIRHTVESTGRHTLRVYGAGRGVYTSYDLSLEVERNCTDDDSEPNSLPEEAALLDPLAQPLADRFICEEDDDWYAIALFPGESLDATLSFEHALGDLALELYDGDVALIERVDTDTDDERLSFATQEAVELLLKVPGAPSLVNRYGLELSLTIPECVDDDAEDDDSPQSATSLSVGEVVEGQICAADEDWFVVALPADTEVSVALEFDAQTPMSVALWAPDGESPLAQGEVTPEGQVVTLTPELPGIFLVQVRGEGRYQGAYSLQVTGPTAVCPEDDRLEDNDGIDSPALVTPGAVTDLILCGRDDEDWVSFELGEGQSAEVFVLTVAEAGSLSAALYGPDAVDAESEPVDEARGESSVKRVRVQAGAQAGTWRLRLSPATGDAVPYSLRVNLYDGPLPLGCEFDDAFEPNDVVSDAARLERRQTTDAILCGERSDWFRLDAQAGEVLTVRADFRHADGDLQLVLHGGTPLQPLVESVSEDDGEYLWFQATQSGPLFVEVLAVEPPEAGIVYALTLSDVFGPVPQSCITDDIYEQNDDQATAAQVEEGPISGVHCVMDDDYYAVTVLAGQTLEAALLYDGDSPLDLSLLGEGGDSLALAPGSESDARVLSYTAEADTSAALAVTSEEPADAPYTLRFDLRDAPRQSCADPIVDDALEPNDDATSATPLMEAFEGEARSLCADDEDWSVIMVPAGQRLVAEATFAPEEGNLEMMLLSRDGGGLGASFATIGRERVELPALDEPRVVYLRVFAADAPLDAPLTYTLSVGFELPAGCQADDDESNDTISTATRIQPGTREGLTLCPEDEDYYVISGNTFQEIVVTITFDGEAADLDLGLLDAFFNTVVATSQGLGDQEQVSYLVLFAGDLVISVYSADGRGTDYTMNVRLQ